jgi:hypothetical protein
MSSARSGVGYKVSPKISSELPHLLEILHASAVINRLATLSLTELRSV